MSRISRGYLPAGRNAPAGAATVPSSLRRGRSLAGVSTVDGEDTLDLFASTRRGYSISSSYESDVLNRMGKKASVGSTKVGIGAADEFLAVEVGKHDYDWLLTPPGTPLFSSVDSTDYLPLSTSQRSTSSLRPASLAKTSRLSVPQSENNMYGPRMARSSSTTRASSTSSRTPSSVLNTSTTSVNSRPTTPGTRTRTPSAAAPPPRPIASRSTTPSRTRPSPIEKPKPATQTSRPLTPTSRAHIPPPSTLSSGLNSVQPRPISRSSTPTRRPPPPVANSRPISPVPRSRALVQPFIPPDFPIDAPPNLRTKLPERAISAGRQRPGMALTMRGNSNMEVRGNSNVEVAVSGVSSSRRASSPAGVRGNTHVEVVASGVSSSRRASSPAGVRGNSNVEVMASGVSSSRRASSPARFRGNSNMEVRGNSNVEIVASGVSSSRRASSPAGARGRVADNQAKSRLNGTRDNQKLVENQKPVGPERKLVKPVPGGEIGSYGRTMSKNSLNMALKHMDIRQGTGNMRGASLFPHSIRSAAAATLKDRPVARMESVAATHNGITDYGGYDNDLTPKENKGSSSKNRDEEMIKSLEVGPTMKAYGSSRYDSILLKEDSRSLNWLHGLDEKPENQSHPFDRSSRFEPLPEPFILL